MLDKDEYNEDDVDDYGNDGDHEIEGSSHDIEVGRPKRLLRSRSLWRNKTPPSLCMHRFRHSMALINLY
jgi:hypothetical protein